MNTTSMAAFQLLRGGVVTTKLLYLIANLGRHDADRNACVFEGCAFWRMVGRYKIRTHPKVKKSDQGCPGVCIFPALGATKCRENEVPFTIVASLLGIGFRRWKANPAGLPQDTLARGQLNMHSKGAAKSMVGSHCSLSAGIILTTVQASANLLRKSKLHKLDFMSDELACETQHPRSQDALG